LTLGWYRRKPAVVEAYRFGGFEDEDVVLWLESHLGRFEFGSGVGPVPADVPDDGVAVDRGTGYMWIVQKAEMAPVRPGEWVVREPDGWFYPVSDEEFRGRYEPAFSSGW